MRYIAALIAVLFLSFSLSAERDDRVREYLSPTRIVWTESPQFIENSEALLIEGTGQSDLSGCGVCLMRSTEEEHPSILLDFGRELHGGLQIVTGQSSTKKPVRVRIRFGESASEAMSEIDGRNGASNDHAVRDFEMFLPWLGTAETGQSGYRFVRIDLLDDDVTLHLKEIRAVAIYRDVPYRGSFSCNDERLNQIWQTGAYTVHQCMQTYLWDGIKRDRLVWMGDIHPEVMTIANVFGYTDIVPRSLDFVRDITPLPSWMNGLYTYSFWWVIVQRDWFMFQGDLEYLEQQREYLKGLLDVIIGCVDDEGLQNMGAGFLDWPSNADVPAMTIGTQALIMMALEAGVELCTWLQESQMAEKCAECHERMLLAAPVARERYFSESKEPGSPGSKQAAALMALSGIADAAEMNRDILSQDGARGFTTFYGYYMLQAMAKAGDYQNAMDMIRTFWGAMLDLGATTFWEDFNIDWMNEDVAPIDELVPIGKKDIHGDFGAYCYKGFRHSLCHGWASGPTAWLINHVLGVEVLEPGCKVIRIVPHLGDLEWAEGTFPTPLGDVKISHKRTAEGKVVSKIDSPKGIKIIKK